MSGDWSDRLGQLVAELDNLIPLLRYVPQHILTEPTPTEPTGLELLLGISRVDAQVVTELDPGRDIPSLPPDDEIPAVLEYVRTVRLALVEAVEGIDVDLDSSVQELIERSISNSTDILRQIAYRVYESPTAFGSPQADMSG